MHKFSSSYVYVSSKGKCLYCCNERILDQLPIYEYTDRTYQFTQSYESLDALKKTKPELNHQLLRNIIREERWLTPHNGNIYSILEPHDGKLDLYKPLTNTELFVINILGIHFESMRNHISGSVLSYILALDESKKIAYFAKSATEMGRRLLQKNSSKSINRKTIPKFINSQNLYGGYKWINYGSPIYKDYTMIDVNTM